MKPLMKSRTIWAAGLSALFSALSGNLAVVGGVPPWLLATLSALSTASALVVALLRREDSRHASGKHG